MNPQSRVAIAVITMMSCTVALVTVSVTTLGCGGCAPTTPVADMTNVTLDVTLVVTSDGSPPATRDTQGLHIQQGSTFRLEPSWSGLPGDARTTTMGLNFDPVPTGIIAPERLDFRAVGAGTLEVTGNVFVYYNDEEYHFKDTDTITVFE